MTIRMLLLATVTATQAWATPPRSLITNGSFEAGDFTTWTQSGNTQYSSISNQPYDGLYAQDGAYYALLGPAGSEGVLSQSFIDAPGAALRISFWLASNGGMPSDFSASYDGAALMHLANSGVFGWTEYTATVSGTGADALRFSFRDDQNYFALDNIAVSQVVAVPEPASWLVLPAAFLVFARRRRAR